MPPRPAIRALRPQHTISHTLTQPTQLRKTYASVATAITPAASLDYASSAAPIQRFPRTQPPSYKPPELRKSQLFRQYASLLESTPLMLLFQHNNLKATEWAAIRRELAIALRKVSGDQATSTTPPTSDPADAIRLTTIQTGIFAAALRVVEFYDPASQSTHDPSAPIHATQQASHNLSHRLSAAAHAATRPRSVFKSDRVSYKKRTTDLHTLLSGPIAVLTFPGVTPAHLAAALSILAPTPGASSKFPAPRRKAAPGYYETSTQLGLQKLLLLGARVEGRVMDGEGLRWVGGIEGGIGGLRSQLVHLLQSVGMGVTGALEGAGRSLYVTMEGRRMDMEEKEKPQSTEESTPSA